MKRFDVSRCFWLVTTETNLWTCELAKPTFGSFGLVEVLTVEFLGNAGIVCSMINSSKLGLQKNR